ncbi:MAG TPA: hypothetical protein VNX18_11195 [Bryobacteraceae bacterium]|nr:hypothetical protein [Bryobacteraceae bacterium]
MPQATYDDVNLILKLYDMRREETLRAARAWFSSSFKVKTLAEYNALCPPGSEPNAYVRQVTTYWDMVGSFVTAEVLDKELFFQSGRELLFVWTRFQPVIAEFRTAIKDPNYLEHLESVGTAFAEHFKKRNVEAYVSFVARVRG